VTVRPLRILLLGGTAEGSALAARLASRRDVAVISSLAGRTSRPALPQGSVRVGGFGGATGLGAFLEREAIDVVVDATHPFAGTISRNAADTTAARGVPLLVLERPAWSAHPDDRWHHVPDAAAAARSVTQAGKRVFLTTGRQNLAPFAACEGWFLIRTIDPPEPPLPRLHDLLMSRGPFTFEEEYRLLSDHRIDVVVSKNSGGDATYAKIAAARELGIPVVLVERPPRRPAPTVADVDAALVWIDERFA
jgi:precorrin-6A/cobalt-precorrin-6A reductase